MSHEITLDRMIDNETVNPFRMLSAYFTTNAMSSPPYALTKIQTFNQKITFFWKCFFSDFQFKKFINLFKSDNDP